MKESNSRLSGSVAATGLTAALILLGALASTSRAQIVISDGNSTATINTNSQAGMSAWTIDGQNQLSQQWFWFRIGASGTASSIDSMGNPTILNPTAQNLTLVYANASASIQLTYNIAGGNAGPGTAGMNESITISNRTGAALDFHFFQYSNFRLAGGTGTDTIQLGKDISGLYNYALQQNSSGLQVQEADLVPSSSHGEAALYNSTLNRLNTTTGLQLNDVATAGPGDATWAFEWDYSGTGMIPANNTKLISKVLSLTVPEPSAAALLGIAWMAFALRLRRWRQ